MTQEKTPVENEGIIRAVIILTSLSLLLTIGAPYMKQSEEIQISPNPLHQMSIEAHPVPALGSSFQP